MFYGISETEYMRPENWMSCDRCNRLTHEAYAKQQLERTGDIRCESCGASMVQWSPVEQFGYRDIRRINRRIRVWNVLNRVCPRVVELAWFIRWMAHC